MPDSLRQLGAALIPAGARWVLVCGLGAALWAAVTADPVRFAFACVAVGCGAHIIIDQRASHNSAE